jgi:hypothetical protein
MQRQTIAIVVTTILSVLFISLTIWGLSDVYRLNWCEAGWLSCDKAIEVVIYSFLSAIVAAAAAFLCVWAFRNRMKSLRPINLITVGVVCAVFLIAVYPLTHEIRGTIAAKAFPYVTAIRFGPQGFFAVWGAVSLLVCCAVMLVMTLFQRKRQA